MKKLILLFLMTFWAHSALASNACTLSQGCWQFTEGSGTTSADGSGKGNTLTFGSSGHPAWSSTVPSYAVSGSAPYSVSFASGDTLYAAQSSSLNNLGPLTATAWVYATSAGDSNTGLVFSKTASSTQGWKLLTNNGTVVDLEFEAYFNTTDLIVRTATTLSLNTWYFVAVTWDGSTDASNVHIYTNNSEGSYNIQTSGSGSYVSDASNALYIGNKSSGTGTWGGNITSVNIFNSVLSSSQLTALYDYGPSATFYHTDIIQNSKLQNAVIN